MLTPTDPLYIKLLEQIHMSSGDTMAELPPLLDLTGRTAFITGSTRGLGWSAAQCMASLGATVAINGRKAEACAQRSAEIEALGGAAIAAPCDVGDRAALDATIDGVVAKTGSLDILVANAAHYLVKPIEDTADDEIDAVFDVKLVSAVAAARKVAPLMIERGWGRIVLVASIGVIATGGLAPVDAAASGGLASFAKALSSRLARHGVTCNTVAPGFISTDMTALYRDDPANAQWIATRVPAGRWGRPEEIGWPIALLATDASSFVTGHTLVVDGGITSSY